MAMRQYIGARYVPRFMGTYDVTQQYEALDVVDNGMGTSYVAKIPTPPGTPLTDTTHWAIYGAASGAVVNLQNQIDAINGEIDGEYVYSEIKNVHVLASSDTYSTLMTRLWNDFYNTIKDLDAKIDLISVYVPQYGSFSFLKREYDQPSEFHPTTGKHFHFYTFNLSTTENQQYFLNWRASLGVFQEHMTTTFASGVTNYYNMVNVSVPDNDIMAIYYREIHKVETGI